MKPPPDDDLKDLFVTLEPPPGGLTRLRARRDQARSTARPWWIAAPAGLVVAAIALLVLWPRPPPPSGSIAASPPAVAPVDLIADRDAVSLPPTWIGLGRLPAPAEPLSLAGPSALALAAHRVPVADQAVVFYMLESTPSP
ncbi:MAG: hypothetical protein R3B09_24365 [Nannocystaceae bacterium]